MSNFEVSKNVVAGLKLLENESFDSKFISNAVRVCLGYETNVQKSDEFKQAEAAILTLYALATKHNYDGDLLKTFLEKLNIPGKTTANLINVFETYRADLHNFVSDNETTIFPFVTDVDWKLTYDLKSSMFEPQSKNNEELTYTINLGNFQSKSGDRQTITEFECNTEELQSLIYKLKEIERHCEKICQK